MPQLWPQMWSWQDIQGKLVHLRPLSKNTQNCARSKSCKAFLRYWCMSACFEKASLIWHGVQACLNVCLTSGPNIDAMKEDCMIAISLGSTILARSEAHDASTKMHSRGLNNDIPWRSILTSTFTQVYLTDSASVLITLANSHYNVSWEATHTSHTVSAVVRFGRRHTIATCNKTLFYCEHIAH